MNWVDLAVLGVIALSALVGLMRGLVREVLGLAAWAAALLIASPYGVFPYVQPFARQNIADSGIADGVAFGLVFLAALVVLSVVVSRISYAVRGSVLGGLDRTLGLPFGVARGVVLFAVAFVVGGSPDGFPGVLIDPPTAQDHGRWSELVTRQMARDETSPGARTNLLDHRWGAWNRAYANQLLGRFATKDAAW